MTMTYPEAGPSFLILLEDAGRRFRASCGGEYPVSSSSSPRSCLIPLFDHAAHSEDRERKHDAKMRRLTLPFGVGLGVPRRDPLCELLVDIDGGERLLSLAGMEEKYGEMNRVAELPGYDAKRAEIAPALCHALGRADFSWHTAGLHVGVIIGLLEH
jgi:hypothetical protein